MDIELIDLCEHLAKFSPFAELPQERLEQLVHQIEVGYYRAGTPIVTLDQKLEHLYFIRSGAVEVYRRNGTLYNRLSEGDIFGQLGLLMHKHARFPATALEDSLIYRIPKPEFDSLFQEFEHFADFVEVEDRSRLRQAVAEYRDSNQLLNAPVKQLLSQRLLHVAATARVQDAAKLMTLEDVSSLLVTQPIGADEAQAMGLIEDPSLKMVGILTDRDLRTRFLVPGLPMETAVGEIMTSELISIEDEQFVFEAMLLMLRHRLHHLPVLRRRHPIGIISQTDIVRHESQSSLFVVRNIFAKDNLPELISLVPEVRASFIRMVAEDANSHMIGSAMAAIGRSFKQRLLQLAEQELGPPPVDYCFLALGSMARSEQLIVTDQDNALILANDYDPKQHGDYFQQLAKIVCDGLAACGYSYCTGGIMATNPSWQMTRQQWQSTFERWISKPSPKSLLDSSIFFDLDGVHGQTHWANELRDQVALQASQATRFLAAMGHNAQLRTPPLGFFKDFVLEKDGKHKNSMNLKRRGTAPLTDLIRVHALAAASSAQNSFQRLDDLAAKGFLAPGIVADLKAALEFISMVRIRHQAMDLEQGREPDNNIEPENLSPFERRSLKDAFLVVSNAQKFLTFRYQPNRAK